MENLTWIEISRKALKENIRQFRGLIGKNKILCPCVKGNAYGHGIKECSEIFINSGADWLAVNALYEAEILRKSGIKSPIYILGYVPLNDLEEAVKLNCRLVVYNKETVHKLGKIKTNKKIKIHLKIETGNNRQGVLLENLFDFIAYIKEFKNIEIEGISTHFANIEDTRDYSYPKIQIGKFKQAIKISEDLGLKIPIKHCANSAASILFSETYFDMVRPGISTYGMWPSEETYKSYLFKKTNGLTKFHLKPAFTWKTKIAQIKNIEANEFIGYGCTYKTKQKTKIAVLPVGYYDGYDRGVKNAYVLVGGEKAKVLGRICMNMIMIDVTKIPSVNLEDEVVLIGQSGEKIITPEEFAKWAGTINYEITTRINERIPRIIR